MRSSVIALAVAVAVALVLVACETNERIKQGEWEMEGTVSLTHTENDFSDSDAIEVDALLNLAINSGFQLGPLFVFDARDDDLQDGTDVDSITYFLAPNFRFNLPGSGIILPYVDVAAGTAYIEADTHLSNGSRLNDRDTGLFLQGALGLRFFVSEWAAINVSLRYRYLYASDDVGGDVDSYGMFAGLSVFF